MSGTRKRDGTPIEFWFDFAYFGALEIGGAGRAARLDGRVATFSASQLTRSIECLVSRSREPGARAAAQPSNCGQEPRTRVRNRPAGHLELAVAIMTIEELKS
jgi:hypothetical protein